MVVAARLELKLVEGRMGSNTKAGGIEEGVTGAEECATGGGGEMRGMAAFLLAL